jgi:RNA polymerase sigma-70 factor (ECF subfamily)
MRNHHTRSPFPLREWDAWSLSTLSLPLWHETQPRAVHHHRQTTRMREVWPVNPPGRMVVIPGVEAQRGSGRGEPDPPGQDADAAFVRALYAEHGPALLRHATRLAGDRGRAEDLVQETLLRAWRHADRLADPARPVRPWLHTVLAHLATDAHRAARARPPETGEQALAGLPGDTDLDRALQAWQVTEALGGLSAAHRAVLLETYYRGRSVTEAAETLGVPPGTVKSRTYYALRALRLALAEQGGRP